MNIKSDTESSFTFKRGDIESAHNYDNIKNIKNNQNGGGLFCSDEFNNILYSKRKGPSRPFLVVSVTRYFLP